MSCSPLDQLVVDLALALDLLLGLELGGQPGLELAEADVVQARGVDVVSGNSSVGMRSELAGAIHRPVRPGRVVYGNEDLTVHGCPDWRLSRDQARVVQPCNSRAADAVRPGRKRAGGSPLVRQSGRPSPEAVAERSAYIHKRGARPARQIHVSALRGRAQLYRRSIIDVKAARVRGRRAEARIHSGEIAPLSRQRSHPARASIHRLMTITMMAVR